MYEISAKAYCEDHASDQNAPKAVDSQNNDKKLVIVLRDIYNYMIAVPGSNKPDQAMQKLLHGALTALASSESILSVTSMNQLVHNPRFSVRASDISVMFHNIYPLLEALNKS